MSQEPEIVFSEVAFSLAPSGTALPLQPIVGRANVRMTDRALAKLVGVALARAREKTPVDVELVSSRFVEGGAELTAQVSKGRILRADVRAVISIVAEGTDRIVVEVQDVKALGKLPLDAFIEPVLEKALSMAGARPGITRESARPRTLAIAPDELLASLGLPFRFATPGTWRVRASAGSLEATFAATA